MQQFRLGIIEINRFHRFLNVQPPRFAIQPDPAPVVNPVGGVGILLDLKNEVSRVYRMQASTPDKERIPTRGGEAAHQRFKGFLLEGLPEGRRLHPRLQPRKER